MLPRKQEVASGAARRAVFAFACGTPARAAFHFRRDVLRPMRNSHAKETPLSGVSDRSLNNVTY